MDARVPMDARPVDLDAADDASADAARLDAGPTDSGVIDASFDAGPECVTGDDCGPTTCAMAAEGCVQSTPGNIPMNSAAVSASASPWPARFP